MYSEPWGRDYGDGRMLWCDMETRSTVYGDLDVKPLLNVLVGVDG